MTISITIDLWNTVYAASLVYSFIALYLIFSTPTWAGGNPKMRFEFIGFSIIALVPILNIIIMTVLLATSGKYEWLVSWFDSPLIKTENQQIPEIAEVVEPVVQDVKQPDAVVESSTTIQLENKDGA